MEIKLTWRPKTGSACKKKKKKKEIEAHVKLLMFWMVSGLCWRGFVKISGSQTGVSSGHAVSAFGSCGFLSFAGETFNVETVQHIALLVSLLLI